MEESNCRAALELVMEDAIGLGLEFARKRTDLLLEEKEPGQFATEADREIERLIRRGIESRFDVAPIVGEELGGHLSHDVSGWAIDPIDGTSNFLRDLPFWGISVALLDQGTPILGAIALPELGISLSAQRGSGLWLSGVSVKRVPKFEAVRMIALGENDYEAGPDTDSRAENLRENGYAVVRYRCAALSLAYSALGSLDGYLENGCGLWDLAAGWLLCQEAGLSVDVRQVDAGRYFIFARHI